MVSRTAPGPLDKARVNHLSDKNQMGKSYTPVFSSSLYVYTLLECGKTQDRLAVRNVSQIRVDFVLNRGLCM